jgi:predicted  nucleic acid-binding Zn-ribbon protein
VAEHQDLEKRAAAIEKSRKEIAALQERIKALRRRYARAEPKVHAPESRQHDKRQGAAYAGREFLSFLRPVLLCPRPLQAR